MLAKKVIVPSVRMMLPRFLSTNSGENELVLTKEVNNNGLIIFNRPKALNAANLEFCERFGAIINDWKNTKSLIVARGSGDKAYCAGGDVIAMAKNDQRYTDRIGKVLYEALYELNDLKIPYVALIDGIAMGTGLGLSVYGKYRVATERTISAMPEVIIGFWPDNGSSYFLTRLEGKLGYYLGLTGCRLKGQDVLHSGLATHYCDSSKIPELQQTLLNMTDANDIENVLERFCPKPKSEFSLSKYIDQINKCFDADSIEEILENLKNDGSSWAKQTIRNFEASPPTSLKVTLRNMQFGSTKSLGECLQMDYRVGYHLMQHGDFHEGVRALLLDKDNKPRWNPKRLEDVSENLVQSFFQPGPIGHELDIDVKLPYEHNEKYVTENFKVQQTEQN